MEFIHKQTLQNLIIALSPNYGIMFSTLSLVYKTFTIYSYNIITLSYTYGIQLCCHLNFSSKQS